MRVVPVRLFHIFVPPGCSHSLPPISMCTQTLCPLSKVCITRHEKATDDELQYLFHRPYAQQMLKFDIQAYIFIAQKQ
jgi:hypothetical protein